MSEPLVGAVQIWSFSFAPLSWAFCNGALLNINQNSALFSILGTTYGGDGVQTFALPNLAGRGATHRGNGPGLTPLSLGQTGGEDFVTLTVNQLPSHRHTLFGEDQVPESPAPTSNSMIGPFVIGGNPLPAYAGGSAGPTMASGAIANVGGSQSHENRQPYLVMSFCIATRGIYPSRG